MSDCQVPWRWPEVEVPSDVADIASVGPAKISKLPSFTKLRNESESPRRTGPKTLKVDPTL